MGQFVICLVGLYENNRNVTPKYRLQFLTPTFLNIGDLLYMGNRAPRFRTTVILGWGRFLVEWYMTKNFNLIILKIKSFHFVLCSFSLPHTYSLLIPLSVVCLQQFLESCYREVYQSFAFLDLVCACSLQALHSSVIPIKRKYIIYSSGFK